MKKLIAITATLCFLIFTSVVVSAEENEVDNGFKSFGESMKNAGTEVGHGFRDLGKEIGEQSEKAGKKVAEESKEAGSETKSWWQGLWSDD
jgi:hypothetical protein